MTGHENKRAMQYNPDIHHRRSIRLRKYDYSRANAYFVTICVHQHQCLFGHIVVGATGWSPLQGLPISQPKMILNDYGLIVCNEWMKTPGIRPEIQLGEFIIMPNHFHGIIRIKNTDAEKDIKTYGNTEHVGAYSNTPLRSPSKTIGAILRGFKSAVTKRINEIRRTPGIPVWQRNYYEHIIRNENDFNRIREYITQNPANWQTDELYTVERMCPILSAPIFPASS